MSARRRAPRKQARGGRRPSWIAAVGWLITLFVSLLMVTWRQTQGLEMEQALRGLEGERAVLETEGVGLSRQIEELRSRSRVLRVARSRLGMHLPAEDEIVFLQVELPRAVTLAASETR
jgi:cell division protein FtsL